MNEAELATLTAEEVVKMWHQRGAKSDDRLLVRWEALQSLPRLEERFRAGNRFALFQAVAACARCDLQMPTWVARGFLRGYDAVVNLRMGSWDEAFGRPYPKGMHIAKGRLRRLKRFQVYSAAKCILACEPATPIDERLFERVGKDCGVSRSVANQLYYEAKRSLGWLLPAKM